MIIAQLTQNTVSKKYDGAREEAEEMVSKGKSKYDEAKREVKNASA